MPIHPNGFVAGTKVMACRGPVNIEDLKPGDMIQVQPVEQKPADRTRPMLPRLYTTSFIMFFAVKAATAIAGPPTAADCAPSCERTVNTTKAYLVPEQHATTVPSLKLHEVATTVPTMDLKIEFKEEKRTVLVTSLKPREEDRVFTSTTMVLETQIDPCTKCPTITYKPVCLTKIVKVTVMDCVQEPREAVFAGRKADDRMDNNALAAGCCQLNSPWLQCPPQDLPAFGPASRTRRGERAQRLGEGTGQGMQAKRPATVGQAAPRVSWDDGVAE